jgi:calcium uniporter
MQLSVPFILLLSMLRLLLFYPIRIDELRAKLGPLELQRRTLDKSARRHATRVVWVGGLGLAAQWGALFRCTFFLQSYHLHRCKPHCRGTITPWLHSPHSDRLTWWELSWDIIEPVSFFLTFGMSITAYFYYMWSKREYTNVDLHNTLRYVGPPVAACESSCAQQPQTHRPTRPMQVPQAPQTLPPGAL